jgi:hypothetical protein
MRTGLCGSQAQSDASPGVCAQPTSRHHRNQQHYETFPACDLDMAHRAAAGLPPSVRMGRRVLQHWPCCIYYRKLNMEYLMLIKRTYQVSTACSGASLLFIVGSWASTVCAQAFPLSTLDGSNGFRVNGMDVGSQTGEALGSAGDLNGDGIGDLATSAPYNDGVHNGEILLVFGRKSNFPAALASASLNGSNGFRFTSATVQGFGGSRVTGGHDINGDGIDDLVVGAPIQSNNGLRSGAVFVVFGRPDFPASLSVEELDGSNGFRVDGVAAEQRFGMEVASLGDINGDGLGDIAIGAPRSFPGDPRGSAYVVFGRVTFPANFVATTLNGSNGFRVLPAVQSAQLGQSVAGIGDVNGDGRRDFLLGAAADAAGSGAAYIIYGRATWPASFFTDSLTLTTGWRIHGQSLGDRLGEVAAPLGDFNNDGLPDFVVGAPYSDLNGMNTGSAYVIYGTANPGSDLLQVVNLPADRGFRVDSIGVSSPSAWMSLAGPGDVSGDGLSDLLIGVNDLAGNGPNTGGGFTIYGTATAPAVINLATISSDQGRRFDGGDTFEFAGFSVSGAGDINDDGANDFAIGAYGAELFPVINWQPVGTAYVVYGASTLLFRDGFEVVE